MTGVGARRLASQYAENSKENLVFPIYGFYIVESGVQKITFWILKGSEVATEHWAISPTPLLKGFAFIS
jgi:hypothetical protein